MMDALVSDKPEFVRLFVDSGANMADFLTYGRLQQLYRSVSPKSLLFDLLQRKHEEGRLTLAGLGGQHARDLPTGPPAFSLHEVSRVLKDFLHDACRGFYQDGRAASRRKAVRRARRAWGQAAPAASRPRVLQERGPAKRPTGQKWLLDLNQRSEDPWRDLFLWAVLQNRHEMANYFWAMVSSGRAPHPPSLGFPGFLGGGSGGRPPETSSPRARRVWQQPWPPVKSSKRCPTWRRRQRWPAPCARPSTSSWPWVSDRRQANVGEARKGQTRGTGPPRPPATTASLEGQDRGTAPPEGSSSPALKSCEKAPRSRRHSPRPGTHAASCCRVENTWGHRDPHGPDRGGEGPEKDKG